MKNEVGGSDVTIEKAVGGNLWALLWQHTHPAPTDGQPDTTPFGELSLWGERFPQRWWRWLLALSSDTPIVFL